MATLARKQNTRVLGKELVAGSNPDQARQAVTKSSFNPDSFEPGQAKEGEKPSDFAGIWKGPLRDIKTLREKAWPQRS